MQLTDNHPRGTTAATHPETIPAGLLPEHWAELQASGIAPDVAAANIVSFGPGTDRHWEDERAELVRFDRLRIQTGSTTGRGLPQAQPGHLSEALARLDRRYRHLAAGGWRTISATLAGGPQFDQWKPRDPRQKGKLDRRTGEWRPQFDEDGLPVPQKYESPPAFPDGGGLLLPNVPERCWRLICQRQRLPFPTDPATLTAGFWAWAERTPELEFVAPEGCKKALAAISAGYAAVAVPGVTMGYRGNAETGRRLITELQALACPGRRWRIVFDAETKPATARKVAAAARYLARTLRAAGSRAVIARLPLLPGTKKTGLDDLLVAAGPEALAEALANTSPPPVLPRLRAADRIAPAGEWLGVACPIPSPEVAPLVVIQAPMGCGKTRAVREALAPLQAEGVPILAPYHRKTLGQAGSDPEKGLGVPWCPAPGSDERQQGIAACLDSWCPESPLRVTGHGWSGGGLNLDECGQQLEHLLLSTGTALGDNRRASTMRTLAEQAQRARQTIALDAQLSEPAVRLLERLTGRRAFLIRSDHRPMLGRHLHAPQGFTQPEQASRAFRVRWSELVQAGDPFLCWTSAQQARYGNAPQTLAVLHKRWRPADLVDVIDSSTPELAAELAADPDGFAERRTREAREQGVNWSLYTSPAVSSGLSFERWQPAAVIAYTGGRIAPEHVAQAVARVRCPDVPVWIYAPEIAPGNALEVRGASRSTDPAQLIADLRAAGDPWFGVLEGAGADGAWLECWAEMAAIRNRQRDAYRATVAGLLEREGWELQAPEPKRADAEALADQISEDLAEIGEAALAAQDDAIIDAAVLTDAEAAALAERRRDKLTPAERAGLDRFELAQRWGLGAAAIPPELLEAEREGLRKRLRLGWLLTSPEALALIPAHDRNRIASLDALGQPFAPDRLRVTLAPRVGTLQALGLDRLLERFAKGETIAATDPAVLELHSLAIAHRRQIKAATGISPGAKASGTLRALLRAVGWELVTVGRVKARGEDRDAYTYGASWQALPEGVNPEALAAAFLAELQEQDREPGAKNRPIGFLCRAKKSPSAAAPPPLARLRPLSLRRAAAVPWIGRPPRATAQGFAVVAC